MRIKKNVNIFLIQNIRTVVGGIGVGAIVKKMFHQITNDVRLLKRYPLLDQASDWASGSASALALTRKKHTIHESMKQKPNAQLILFTRRRQRCRQRCRRYKLFEYYLEIQNERESKATNLELAMASARASGMALANTTFQLSSNSDIILPKVLATVLD